LSPVGAAVCDVVDHGVQVVVVAVEFVLDAH
jgi:hypothetical protein